MCPELSFERFGWFACQLIGYHDEAAREEARKLAAELAAKNGVDEDLITIENSPDWRWSWESLVPRHYTECPLHAPLSIGVGEIVGERRGQIGFKIVQSAAAEWPSTSNT
jgi:hypothetical protein